MFFSSLRCHDCSLKSFVFTNSKDLLRLKPRILEFAKTTKLFYPPTPPQKKKNREAITSQKAGSRRFKWITNSILNEGKSVILPQFNGLEILSNQSNKAVI